MKSPMSAKSMTSGMSARISAFVFPWRTPLRMMLSRPESWLLNPAPKASIIATRPRTATLPRYRR